MTDEIKGKIQQYNQSCLLRYFLSQCSYGMLVYESMIFNFFFFFSSLSQIKVGISSLLRKKKVAFEFRVLYQNEDWTPIPLQVFHSAFELFHPSCFQYHNYQLVERRNDWLYLLSLRIEYFLILSFLDWYRYFQVHMEVWSMLEFNGDILFRM